jgi:hypothetical protein
MTLLIPDGLSCHKFITLRSLEISIIAKSPEISHSSGLLFHASPPSMGIIKYEAINPQVAGGAHHEQFTFD